MAKLPLNPARPERICWGCDRYCAADDLRCGNGTIRTQHPVELFGEGWNDWGLAAADDVITNNDGVAALETQVIALHQHYLRLAYDESGRNG